ncbi:hypothetical protein [Pseudoalteromonas xiamenensis]|uniref:Uncharacterized protein n=1 Tax=Pseudoalteromonas xiamenensis TaxID=882626 RepID=A0A975HM28_9GAMM|nr:hypothetical protein [Pseudoalteromonas xiamenensis]QTH72716.1 hypothetical protein J5O05_08070 [Pseudoalteromonas xiamenensis]
MKALLLLLLAILGGVLLVDSVSAGQNIQSVFCVILLLLVVLSKNEFNSLFLVLIFFVTFLLSKILFYPIEAFIYPKYSPLLVNSVAFGVQFFVDVLMIYFVKNRMRFSLMLTNGKDPSVMEKNYAEGPLYGLLLGYATGGYVSVYRKCCSQFR